MSQHLFDPKATQPVSCPAPGCQAIRLQGQHLPIVTCAHDLNPDQAKWRPRGCLNTSQADLPEDF